MVTILKITSIIFLGVQIFTFCVHNKYSFEKWVTCNNVPKARWVTKRDNYLLFQFLCFLTISILLIVGFENFSILRAYIVSILIFGLTATQIIFYDTNFKIFEPFRKTKPDSRILISEKFVLKTITESDLKNLIYNDYSNSFNSEFNDFKQIFIDQKTSTNKLICVDKVPRSRDIGYLKIFELMSDLSENSILDLMEDERKKFLNFVIQNFKRGNKKIVKENLNSAYTKWLKQNR